MFYINDKKVEITKHEVAVGKLRINGDDYGHLCIVLEFVNTDTKEKGYFRNSSDLATEKEVTQKLLFLI